jgi:pyridoxamine 5'-phosphate oxidase
VVAFVGAPVVPGTLVVAGAVVGGGADERDEWPHPAAIVAATRTRLSLRTKSMFRPREYAPAVDARAQPLNEADVDRDPFRQFEAWFTDAAAHVRTPEAMAIATASPECAPSVRMVLLKSFDETGFVFFSGYRSRKARELDANRFAALLFYWDPLGRQVRIEGSVDKVERAASERYFHSRPRSAQIAALASRQSEVLGSRVELDARVTELERKLGGEGVPLPDHWGGFRLVPATFEFWQHRESRLHDRLRYRHDGERWLIERLYP